jgi:hypothetical protein
LGSEWNEGWVLIADRHKVGLKCNSPQLQVLAEVFVTMYEPQSYSPVRNIDEEDMSVAKRCKNILVILFM